MTTPIGTKIKAYLGETKNWTSPKQVTRFAVKMPVFSDGEINEKMFWVNVGAIEKNTINGNRVRKPRVSGNTPSPVDLGWISNQPAWDDNAEWKVFRKAEKQIQKFFLAMAIETLVGDMGQHVKIDKWSQKAFCACGCSPGWILKDTDVTTIGFWQTFSVDVELASFEQ